MIENWKVVSDVEATLYDVSPTLYVSLLELQPVLKALMRIKAKDAKRSYMRSWRSKTVMINIPKWEDIVK